MYETQGLCMQGLAWANSKTIIYKLFVLAVYGSLYNFITAVKIIIKKGMAYVFHVYPYLVCSSCLQNTLHHGYIIKSFQYFVMSNGFFSVVSFRISFKQFSVPQI